MSGRTSWGGSIRTKLKSARAWIWTAVVLILGVATAVVLVVEARTHLPASKEPDLWLEVARAGVQLGVVAVLGGVVALALRSVDAAREDRRRVREYRLSILHDLLNAYNGIKAARRTLRAFGFRSPDAGSLSDEQIAEYRARSGSLIDIQLSLEKIVRELKARPNLFADSEALRKAIDTAEKYVHDLGKEWEDNGVWLQTGADVTRLAELSALQAFLRTRGEDFENRVSEPMKRALETIGREL